MLASIERGSDKEALAVLAANQLFATFIELPLAGLVGELRIEQQALANALQHLQYMTP